jgi:hypothetical protein
MSDATPYQIAVDANLAHMIAGLSDTEAAEVKACFDSRMAAGVTPEEVQAMNDYDHAVMSKIIVAVSDAVRACKASTGG